MTLEFPAIVRAWERREQSQWQIGDEIDRVAPSKGRGKSDDALARIKAELEASGHSCSIEILSQYRAVAHAFVNRDRSRFPWTIHLIAGDPVMLDRIVAEAGDKPLTKKLAQAIKRKLTPKAAAAATPTPTPVPQPQPAQAAASSEDEEDEVTEDEEDTPTVTEDVPEGKRLTPHELLAQLESHYDPNSLGAQVYAWTLAQLDAGIYATEGTTAAAFAKADGKGPNKAIQLGYWAARRVWIDRFHKTEPKIDPASLAPTAQQRLDAAIRQHKRVLDQEHAKRMATLEADAKRAEAAFDRRVQEALRDALDGGILDSYNRRQDHLNAVTKAARNGALTARQYSDLMVVLHPDNFTEEQPLMKRRATAMFQLLNDDIMRTVLVKAAEAPLPASAFPRNAADLMAMRERVRAERKEQAGRRKRGTDTPATRV